MQIRASKLARKHFYSLLHLTDSNACLEQDVVILSLAPQGNGVRIPKSILLILKQKNAL